MSVTKTRPAGALETKSGDQDPVIDTKAVKEVADSLQTAFAEFKQANDERLAEIEKKGKADPLLEEKVNKINDQLSHLEELKSKLTQLETAVKRPGMGGNGGEVKSWDGKSSLSADEVEHKKAVLAYLRKGHDVSAEIERKALSVNSDPDGGYLVHADMNGRIVTKIFETSPVRQFANVITISTDALEGSYDLEEASAGWVNETGARTETNTPQLGAWRIPVHELYAKPKATQKLLDDAVVNIEAWLAGKIADKLSRLEATAFVSGDGVGKPRGFLTYAAGTSHKQIEQIATGANGGFAASGGADKIFDFIYSLKEAYLANARWAMGRLALAKVRQLKDDQKQYLWTPGLGAAPSTLAGYPIAMFEDMPVPATNSLSIALADWSEAYQIVDRQGIRTLRDPYSSKPYVEFYTTKRVGGDVLNFEAIKLLKFGS